MRWYQGMSYPVQSGAPCIGCSDAHFWDHAPFSARLPKYGPFGDVDKIGVAIAGTMAAGIAAHGAVSLVQKKKLRAEKDRIAAEKQGKKVEK